MIMHENDLINHRISWLCQVQGLLFTALMVGLGTLVKMESDVVLNPSDIKTLLLVLCFLGISVAMTSWVSLKAADVAIKRLSEFSHVQKNKNGDYEPIKWCKCSGKLRQPVIGLCDFDKEYGFFFVKKPDPKKWYPFPWHLFAPWNILPGLFVICWIIIYTFVVLNL
jgi:hypothetical protein